MSRARVAPTLRRAHPRPLTGREAMQGKRQPLITYNALDAHRELRALLAVARAAQWYGDMSKPMAPGFKCVCEGQKACAGCSLDRALARLSRVSRKGERK